MKDKFLPYLEISYGFVFSVEILLAIISFHAQIRATILLLAFLGVLLTHIVICVNRDVSKPSKSFFYLSCLWVVKVLVFVVNEGLNIFLRKTILILDWIDLFVLLIIAFLVFISFLIKKPFWYISNGGKLSFIFGIVSLLFLGWVTSKIILSLIDYLRMI